MSEQIKWSEEQKNAIEARGASLLVSAAAGSGKTAVLVERIKRILCSEEQKVAANRIVIVTFTKDAAASLKIKLQKKFSEMIQEDPENEWIQRQQLLLNSAHISTISSFCFDLIRENAAELEVSSQFRIMEETDYALLQKKVLDHCMEQWYQEKPDEMKKLTEKMNKRSDFELQTLIAELYDKIENEPFGMEKMWSTINNPMIEQKVERGLMNSWQKDIQQILRRVTKAKKQAEYVKSEKLNALIQIDFDDISKLEKYLKDGDLQSFSDNKDVDFGSFMKKSYAKEDEGATHIIEAIQAMRGTSTKGGYLGELDKLSNNIGDILIYREEDRKEEIEFFETLYPFLVEYKNALWEQKQEEECLCFSDGEELVLRLLAKDSDGKIQKTEFAESLSKQYDLIMVDEYQDTNNKQDLIFKLLSRNGSIEQQGENLFMVGDVKQSIYAFRNANPNIFMDIYHRFHKMEQTELSENSVVCLNENFRCSPDVVQFVNHVFNQVMTEESSGIDYKEDHQLILGAKFLPKSRPTVFLYQDIGEENKEQETVIEMELAAKKILKMLEEQTPVRVSDTEERPCRPSDFMILLPTSKKEAALRTFVSILNQGGVSVSEKEKEGYLESREITLICNMLRVISNPLLDVPLSAVLRSPIFSFSDDDLALLRILQKKERSKDSKSKNVIPLYFALLEIQKGAYAVSDELRLKTEYCLDLLQSLRNYAICESAEKLIRRIYESTDFLSVMLLQEDGAQKQANLRLLLVYANSYEKNGNMGISGFVRYIDRIRESKKDLNKPSVTKDSLNAVRVMTIHASKGLEAPFVFLLQLDGSVSNNNKKKLLFDSEIGAAYEFCHQQDMVKVNSMKWKYLEQCDKNVTMREKMRLLYVAMTRAQEQLFVGMVLTDKRKKNLFKIVEAKKEELPCKAECYKDWIYYSICQEPNLHQVMPELSDLIAPLEQSEVNILVEKATDETDFIIENSRESTEIDTELIQKIEKQIDYVYPYEESEKLAKCSVTSLLGIHKETLLSRPAFMRKKSVTAAERGTAMHKLLQFMDIANAYENPNGEFENLKNRKILSEEELQSISQEDFICYCQSSLFERVAKANKVWRERKFMLDAALLTDEIPAELSKETKIIGMIDLMFAEDDKLIIVDYKTDFCNEAEELAERYQKQIAFYCAAVFALEGKKVSEAWIFSTHKGKAAQVNLNRVTK